MRAKYIFYIFIYICLYNNFLTAQSQLNTPLEILTFMQASGTKYQVEELRSPPTSRNGSVLPHGAYLEIMDGKAYTKEYKNALSEDTKKWVAEATQLLSVEKPNHGKARNLYQKALARFPENAQLYTLIGETYFYEKKYAEAKINLDKALVINPIDYLARWLLAEILLVEGKTEAALEGISLAHFYNRNQPRLLRRLVEMYAQAGKKYQTGWGFEPFYKNYREADSTVVISAQGVWLTYAMYKAVWEFEPGYIFIKAQQSVSDYLVHQEMEAVVGMYLTFSNLDEKDRRPYPSILYLEKALDAEMLEEYVLYEIILTERPALSNYLTPEFVKRLIKYLEVVRCGKE